MRFFLCTMTMRCMMLMIYDVTLTWCWLFWGIFFWSKLLYVVMTTYDDMYYVSKHYLWSLSLFTWLCVGLWASHEHCTCRLEMGLLVRVCMLCWYKLLNMMCWYGSMVMCIWLLTCLMLLWSLSCIYSLVCALKAFQMT